MIGALIAVEKLLPSRRAANRIVAVALLALGLATAVVSDAVFGADAGSPPGMDMRSSSR